MAKKEEPKKLPTLFKVVKTAMGWELTSASSAEPGVHQEFSKESEAGRLCDLLNGAYVLFKQGEKSQGLDKPTKVGKPKPKK